jgi:hypothetical protein
MRSFSITLKDGFKSGLRSVDSISRNTGILIDGINCSASKTGIEGYSPAVEIMPDIYDSVGVKIDFSVSWPFPQLFQTDTGLYIGNQVGLYQIAYDSTYGYVGTLLTSGYTGGVNWPWSIANCPGFPMFTSGDLLVYYDPDAAAWFWWSKGVGGSAGSVWNSDWYQPVSICYNRGQIMAAGSKTHTTYPSQNREVMWSKIGEAKFLVAPTTHTTMLDSVSNTAGKMYEASDDYGIILRVFPLDKGFIVYSTFSIFALIPITEPVPSFSVTPLLDVGIANPLAVGGPIKGEAAGKQLFVDRLGVLWAISSAGDGKTKSMMPTRLGYEEYLAPLQDGIDIANRLGIIAITYNPYKDEYYISNGQKSFVYNGVGLTPIDKCITSMVDFQKAQVTTGFHYGTLQDAAYGYFYTLFSSSSFLAVTDVIDFKMSARKTMETLHLGMNVPEGATVEVMVEWRNAKNKQFQKTPWKRVSPEGVVSPLVTAVEFRLWVKCSNWDGVELSDITIMWKLVDKNGIRGAYASNTTT